MADEYKNKLKRIIKIKFTDIINEHVTQNIRFNLTDTQEFI